MITKLREIIQRQDDLTERMSEPETASDPKRYAQLAREHSELSEVADKARRFVDLDGHRHEIEDMLTGDDEELKVLAAEELPTLIAQLAALEEELKVLLLPRDPADDKNTILEIRSGTGGEEAALFAADLYRMYSRYAERRNWDTEVLSLSESETGGIKEIIVSVKGKGAYGDLKYERGVHRVQRVPATESSGRIHTSAASVAVLPEADPVEVNIVQADLKIDTYRASGHGGQHVNKTDSAVRITHLPSGIVVTCQDEKSQHKNRLKAMKVLAARLYAKQLEKQQNLRAKERRSMVSTGDRSAKVRTYNFPQGRVTDHRINLTLYRLSEITDGDLHELIAQLRLRDRMDRLAEV
ncbi:MAG: peptide chain release factor 1 [Candidatus Marinimicrobia bacterium]|nr:peptide chain release factor 1 [Candidatus Neomarinimicrobiota bacterium]